MKVYEESCSGEKLAGKIVCSFSDMKGSVIQKLAGIWNLKAESMPMLVGYIPRQNKVMLVQESIKNTPISDLTAENMTTFAKDVLMGKVMPPPMKT